MAGKGREVADAYIEVHGDLSKFRKDLQKAGLAAAKQAGADAGEKFGEEMRKRANSETDGMMRDIFDAAYEDSDTGWDRMFKGFDKNVDEAHKKASEFLKDMHEDGVIVEQDYKAINERMAEGRKLVDQANEAQRNHNSEIKRGNQLRLDEAATQARIKTNLKNMYSEAKEELAGYNDMLKDMDKILGDVQLEEHNKLISDGTRLRMEQAKTEARLGAERSRLIKEAKAELEEFNSTFEGMQIESEKKIFEKNWRRLNEFMAGADVGPNLKSVEATDRFAESMRKAAERARELGKVGDGDLKNITAELDRAAAKARDLAAGMKNTNGEGGRFRGVTKLVSAGIGKMKVSWARMDGTVRLVLALIATAGAEFATLLSGAAGAATALVSSLGLAVGAAIPIAAAVLPIAPAIFLAITAMEEMKQKFPEIVRGAESIGAAWEEQASRFGDAWGEALGTFLTDFGTQLAKYDFGTPLGEAMSGITDAFTDVVNGPAFAAFMQALTGDLADAFEGIGKGVAGVMEWFLSLMAGAAPVAKQLGDDFARWGEKLADAIEIARKDGSLNDVFEKMRDSLLAVLDFTGSLGAALGTLFMIGADSGNEMFRSLARIVDRFNAWMKTEAGRDKMMTWFENGVRIMAALKPVAVGLADALGGLVDEKSIVQLEELMTSLGDLLPLIGDILRALSGLGVLNIFVALLGSLAEIVSPLLPNVQRLGEVVSDTLIGAFDALTPLLKGVVEIFAPLGSVIADVAEVVGPALVSTLEDLATTFQPVIDALGALTEAFWDALGPVLIETLKFALEFMTDKITSMLDIIGGIITFLTGVFTGDWDMAWQGLQDAFDGFVSLFTETFNQFWEALKEPLAAFGEWIAEMWNGMWAGITQAWTDFTTGLTEGWAGFWAGLTETWDGFWTGVQENWTVFTEWLVGIFESVMENITGFFEGIGEAIMNVWTTVEEFFAPFVELIQGIVDRVADIIQTFVDGDWTDGFYKLGQLARDAVDTVVWAWEWMLGEVKRFGADVVKNAKQAWEDAKKNTKQAWEDMKRDISTKAGEIVRDGKAKFDEFKANIKRFGEDAKTNLRTAWENAKRDVAAKIGELVRNGKAKFDEMKANIKRFGDEAKTNLSTAWTNIKTATARAWEEMKATVKRKIDEAITLVMNFPDRAKRALGNLGGNLKQAGRDFVQGFINGVTGQIRAVATAATRIAAAAASAVKGFLGINSPSRLLKKIGRGFGLGFTMGVDSRAKDASESARNLAKAAADGIGSDSEYLKAGITAAEEFANGFDAQLGSLRTMSVAVDPRFASLAPSGAVNGLPSDAPVAGGKSIHIAEGAIQIQTPAKNPETVAGMVIDDFASYSKL